MNSSKGLPRLFHGRLFPFRLALVLMAACPVPASGQFKFHEPPNRRDPRALTADTGEIVWQNFQRNRAIGGFHLEGRLTYRPPRDASRLYSLSLDGDWSARRESTSVTLLHPDGRTFNTQVLVEGTAAAIVDGASAASGKQLSERQMQEPLFDGLPFTWEDLLMPYLQWRQVEYAGPDRYLGRPAHRFLLVNPIAGIQPARVIVTIDEDYAALLKAELYSNDDQLFKRLRVTGFRQFGDEWMFSGLTWELRTTRESILLEVDSFSTGSNSDG